jgi:hypothetical protein
LPSSVIVIKAIFDIIINATFNTAIKAIEKYAINKNIASVQE